MFSLSPRSFLGLVSALVLVLSFSGCGGGSGSSPAPVSLKPNATLVSATSGDTITKENAKTGDTGWEITNPAIGHNLEGFASATSINRGESIKLYVNTIYPTYTIDIYRMGWYGGLGARRVAPTITRTGTIQVLPTPDPDTGLAEANWTDPYVLSVPGDSDPTNWCSGVYLAKLTGGPQQSYILFVVRDDQRHSNYLFQIADATYQAYNNWLGKSLYAVNNPDGVAARKVSYNRPYFRYGAAAFFQWEYPMIRFYEKEGYDLAYSSSIDTHVRGSMLLNHESFVTVGHDEYWSWQMRDAVEGARDAGKNLAFFSSDVSFWQVRFEPSTIDGTANRVMVGYKEAAAQDPFALDSDPTNDKYITGAFSAVGRPEEAMTGLKYAGASIVANDLVIKSPQSFAFAGMNLQVGDVIPGILSGEVDRVTSASPSNVVIIGHSPITYADGSIHSADTVSYQAASGAMVFSAGSFTTSWGVDNYYFPPLGQRSQVASDLGRQYVRNIMNRMKQYYTFPN